MDLLDLFREMRRRRVFRGALIYVLIAWLLAVAASRGVAAAGLDASLLTLVYALLGLGLVAAIAFSWLFQVTREKGVRIEHDHVEAPPRTPLGVALDLTAFGGFGALAVFTLIRAALGMSLLP